MNSGGLKSNFLSVLDEDHNEQFYQKYMEDNTKLIPREFVQNHGIHASLVLRKLSFGADYKSDFFYLSKSSNRWHCVFIEIEKPKSRYFKNNSMDLHPEFLSGINQIKTWKSWLAERANSDHFINSVLSQIRKPMEYNKCIMKFVLVHGRRSEYSSDEKKRNLVDAYSDDDFRIMSFDSLAEDLDNKHELWIGVRKNHYISLESNSFIDSDIFAIMDAPHIEIKNSLKNDILQNSYPSMLRMLNGKPQSILQDAMNHVRTKQ